MVVFRCAYTEQINPAGVTPVLSHDQIWNGLQRKVRRAQDFVPIIDGCNVVEEKDNEITRDIHFIPTHGKPERTVREVCKSYYPVKVDFWQPDGAVITNTVSNGPSFTEQDYNMTYTFEWRRPDVEEGSEQEKKLRQEYVEGSKQAVHSSIEAMRKMAEKGEL